MTNTTTFSTGKKYEGDYKEDKYDGFGVISYPDGRKYEGEFKANYFSGMGIMFWPSGGRYVGNWEGDQRNGEGTMYGADGSIDKGIWKADEIIKRTNSPAPATSVKSTTPNAAAPAQQQQRNLRK